MEKKNEVQLELLISTVNKSSLDFIYDMFKRCELSQLNLLIVNQTTPDCLLESDKTNIRVINSYDRGLSKSRNLAIKNTIGRLCLIADDDLEYVPGFDEVVKNIFKQQPEAGIVHFKAFDESDKPYRTYPKQSRFHNTKTIKGVISFEIAFKKSSIENKNLVFDEHFGLGAEFETAEEYLFCRNALKKGVPVYFENEFIVRHPDENSGKLLGSDKITYARGALNFKIYGNLAYLWVFKYVSFLVRHNYIELTQVPSKIKIALSGIADFKKIK